MSNLLTCYLCDHEWEVDPEYYRHVISPGHCICNDCNREIDYINNPPIGTASPSDREIAAWDELQTEILDGGCDLRFEI